MKGAESGTDRVAIVVQENDQVRLFDDRMVEGFEGDPLDEGAIAHRRDDMGGIMVELPCQRQSQPHGNGGTRMRRLDQVVRAFGRRQETIHSAMAVQ